MKPGPKDKSYPILITGRELTELKKCTWAMAEAFGLDRRIERYQGRRALTLYCWDLDCLEAVTSMALDDRAEYPARAGPAYEAMSGLCRRIKELREKAYAEIKER